MMRSASTDLFAQALPVALIALVSILFPLVFSPLAGFAETVRDDKPTNFPDLIAATNKKPPHGKSTLSFMVSLARRPELMHPQYLRMVLGSPDQARAHSFPANSFSWSQSDLWKVRYSLSRTMGGGSSGGANGFECRQFIVAYGQSKIRLKDLQSRLGKPTRCYFNDRAQPVELYQISPTTTLSASEPINSFDIERIIVSYTGPVLPPVGQQDLFQASLFRQEQIDHHLDRGNRERGLAFLQEHIDDNPEDIEAHLLLADTLQRRSDVNGAIAEYRRALALAQGSSDLPMQKKAIKGLRRFGLAPDQAVSTMIVSQKGDQVR
ncbi:MAG: hypothetical protein KGS72_11765 [Cyanobacteria bacterium REEB67]|nr:hypothetical protein [Cyanobacteria bacterium REEB67]